ncbi:serine-rich adhesin for platelets-like isoform X2 [Mytilus trossulus]|uniref:serine-rich adhesin for platelets-like isoform X2 n=1 Tax=Mytilus trossulus TaxID=6551 RepID=UPI003006F830
MKRNSKFRNGIHKPCERKSIFRTVKDLITPKWLSRLFTTEKQHEPKEPQEEDTRTMSIFGSLKDLLTPSWLTRYITLNPGNINTQDLSKGCKKQTINRDKQHQNVERSPVNTCNQKNNSRCSDNYFPQSTSIPHTGPREDIHQQDQMPVQNTGTFSSSQLPLQSGNIDGHDIDNDDNFSNISDYSGCSSGYSSMNPHQPTCIQEKKALTELNNNVLKKNVNWSAQYNTKSPKKSSLTENSSSGLNLFPRRADEDAALTSNRLIERHFHPGATFGRCSPQKRKWNENCSPSSPHKIPTRQKIQARHVTSSINSNLLISSGAKNMEGTLEKLKTEIEEFHLTSTDNDVSLYDISRKDKCHSVGKESQYRNIDQLSVVSSSTDKESEAQDDCQKGSAGLSSKSEMTSHLNGYSKSSSEFYLTGDSNSSAKFGGKSVLYNNGFIVEKRLTELSERIDQPQPCKYTYSKDLPKQNGSSFSRYYELQPLETEITSEINESTISKEYVVKDESEVMVKSSDNKSRENSSGDTITCDTLNSSSRLSRTPILGTSETASTSQISETPTQNGEISTMAAAIPRTSTPSISTSLISTSASQILFGKSLASTSFFTISETSKVLAGNSNKSTPTVGQPQSALPIYSTSWVSTPTFRAPQPQIPTLGTPQMSAPTVATSLVSTVTFGSPQTSIFDNSMVSVPAFGTHRTLLTTTSTSLLSSPAFGTCQTSAPTTSTSLISPSAFGTLQTSASTTGTLLLSKPELGTLAPMTSTSLHSISAFGTQGISAPITSTSLLSPPAFGKHRMSAPTTSTSLQSISAFGTQRISAPITSTSLLSPPAFGEHRMSVHFVPTTSTSLQSISTFATHQTATASTSLLSPPAFKTHQTSAPNTNTSVPLKFSTLDTSASILAPMVTSPTLGTHTTSETDRMTFGKVQTSLATFRQPQVTTMKPEMSNTPPMCTMKPEMFNTPPMCTMKPEMFNTPPMCTMKPEMFNTPPMCTMMQEQTLNVGASNNDNIANPHISKLRTTVSGGDNCDAVMKRELTNHVPSTKNIEMFIPEYRKPLVSRPIDLSADDCNVSVVTFDLETTGFGYDADIVQICAEVVQITPQIVDMEFQTFQEYILPIKPINPKASEVTGLYSDACSLYYKGQKVNTLSKSVALEKFIKWLPHKAVLVAHNCKNFDSKIIVAQLSSVNLVKEFQCKVFGFSDTLHIFKQKFPDRKSYKQENLVKDILKRSYNAHNAVDDVKLLNILIKNSKVSLQDVINHSFTVEYVHNFLTEFRCKEARLKTFKPVYMSDEPIMSKSLCERAAKSGLKLEHLHLAISCDDFDGLHRLLSEIDDDGNVRVTKMNRIIQNVYNFLTEMK